ncbi:hypothetical protein RHDC4_01913 [Rhodocyclaceae bacterium]|nr:hypothetical protein [Sandaracinaceae bacterium]MCC6873066.1 hypothetical protein [Sandaracinaceae bacterium]CAG0981392.1 hypothetical protein RHDC4_01913 [Rhodocyclaceae bacterium]
MRRVVLGLCFLVGLVGCPRQVQAPEPTGGTPCATLEECNPGLTCGNLRVCVDGRCEREPSLRRPCPGAGEPVVP